jgi:hypothetical protein
MEYQWLTERRAAENDPTHWSSFAGVVLRKWPAAPTPIGGSGSKTLMMSGRQMALERVKGIEPSS